MSRVNSLPPSCYSSDLSLSDFTTRSRDGLAWLECPQLSRLDWLLHAFSTRRGGVSHAPSAGLNLGFTASDERAKVEKNRKLYLDALEAKAFRLAELRQVHSTHVFHVTRGERGKLDYRLADVASPAPPDDTPHAGDALLTDEPGILLPIRTADCLPVLLVDPQRRVVGAAHAGWRGALGRVIEKTVGEMRRLFASEPRQILAALGPSIRACCYEVGEEVVEAFQGRFVEAERFFTKVAKPPSEIRQRYPLLFLNSRPPGHGPAQEPSIHLDLSAVACDQLRSAGLESRNLFVSEFCTACRTDLFFSHRKEGAHTGRLMAVIGIRPKAK